VHPSSILNLFLSWTIVFDAIRARSLWLASYTVLATLYTASIAVKLVWFYLETKSKLVYFINKNVQYGDEEIRGFYNRAFFWWVNPLLLLGFKQSVSLEELPYLDRALSANELHRKFSAHWASSK
jgi:ATP-binding cassette subfamily C (CFTR/MRP) protein 1